MNRLPQLTYPFSVYDAHPQNAAGAAFGQIIHHHSLHVGRPERVQVQHAINGQRDRFAAHSVGFFAAVHAPILFQGTREANETEGHRSGTIREKPQARIDTERRSRNRIVVVVVLVIVIEPRHPIEDEDEDEDDSVAAAPLRVDFVVELNC